MAKLKTFQKDRDAMSGGEWVKVGIGQEKFEIRTRGLTPLYRDSLNVLRRNAAREVNRTLDPGAEQVSVGDLPPTVSDRLAGQAIAEQCFLDVRGLTMEDANGVEQPVTAEQFRDFLRDPEGQPMLLTLAITAANQVGDAKQTDRKAAEGNSSPASAST